MKRTALRKESSIKHKEKEAILYSDYKEPLCYYLGVPVTKKRKKEFLLAVIHHLLQEDIRMGVEFAELYDKYLELLNKNETHSAP